MITFSTYTLIILATFGIICISLMIMNEKALPTIFAKSLGESVGLIDKLETGMNHIAYNEKMQRMMAFQQMAVTCPIEQCKIAFHGFELSEQQDQILDIIYQSTKPWMLGHVVGVLLNRLDDARTTNKDFAESVRTIVEQITKTESGGQTKEVRGMLIELTDYNRI